MFNVWCLSVFLVGLLATAPIANLPASAATLAVTDPGDTGAPGQLRSLINAAAPGDTIVIPPGIITLITFANEDANVTGDLDIHKDLTIQGAGAGSTVLDGGGGDRVIDIFAPATVMISNVTIRNGGFGSRGGGGIRNAGTLTLIDGTVSGNLPGPLFQELGLQDMTGGGILNTGTMTLTNCMITANIATFGRGEFFGGLAFLDQRPRGNDAIALVDTELFVLTGEKFNALAEGHKRIAFVLLSQLAKTLAVRLRHVDDELTLLQEN